MNIAVLPASTRMPPSRRGADSEVTDVPVAVTVKRRHLPDGSGIEQPDEPSVGIARPEIRNRGRDAGVEQKPQGNPDEALSVALVTANDHGR